MSDSIDRVFVKAISTIRTLSARAGYGSLPRPPVENRIRLYGLYKQATEGDVEGIMTRPTRNTSEDESARRKWDAWKSEEGISKTEAKRRYIALLIETMKAYASGTHESRELLSELEYLWDQIKDIKPSPSPPLTPIPKFGDNHHPLSLSGSVYGSGFIEYNESHLPTREASNDIRNELRDVQLLKREVQIALRRLNDELKSTRSNSNGLLRISSDDYKQHRQATIKSLKKASLFLIKLLGGFIKRIVINVIIVIILSNFLKYKNGLDIDSKGKSFGVINRVLSVLLQGLNKLNLVNFERISITFS